MYVAGKIASLALATICARAEKATPCGLDAHWWDSLPLLKYTSLSGFAD